MWFGGFIIIKIIIGATVPKQNACTRTIVNTSHYLCRSKKKKNSSRRMMAINRVRILLT